MSLRNFSAAAMVAALAFATAPSAMASATTPTARLASPASTQAAPILPFNWYTPKDRNRYICQSSNYRSLFVLQTDGNLVVYDETGRARWSSRTAGRGLVVDFWDDGVLVVEGSLEDIWSNNVADDATHGASLVCQNDGNVVIYNYNHVALWSTRTVH